MDPLCPRSLVFAWTYDLGESLGIGFTINREKIRTEMLQFLSEDDPVFIPVLDRVSADILTVNRSALLESVEQTGAHPKEILESARVLSNR